MKFIQLSEIPLCCLRLRKEEEMKLSSKPSVTQRCTRLNTSLKMKKGRKPLSCKKNILSEDHNNESIMKVSKQKLKRKISVKKGKNETSKKFPATSTPIKPCQLGMKRCNIEYIKPVNCKQNLNKSYQQDLIKLNTTDKSTPNNSITLRSGINVSREIPKSDSLKSNKTCSLNRKCQLDSILVNKTTKSTPELSITLRPRKIPSEATSNPNVLESISGKRRVGRSKLKSNIIQNENEHEQCETEINTVNQTRPKRPPKKKSVSELEKNWKSFGGVGTLDDLALTARPNLKRKVKSDGYKIPCKSSLKRKRFLLNEMIHANDNYEDDIYASQEFDIFKDLFEDSSEFNVSSLMSTPKLGIYVTPMIRKRTPVYKEIISPTEYALDRKIAEEIQYRKMRKRSGNVSTNSQKSQVVPEKKKLEFNQVLGNAFTKEEQIRKMMDQSSVMEDSYFSDC